MKPLTRHQRAGARAIDAALRDCAEATMSLYRASCIADAAARAIGRKRDLYPSLYDYETLLPRGARTVWVGASAGDGVLSVINPYSRNAANVTTYSPIPGPFDVATDAHAQTVVIGGR